MIEAKMGSLRVEEQNAEGKKLEPSELVEAKKAYADKMSAFRASLANLYEKSPIQRAAKALEMEKGEVNPYPQLRKDERIGPAKLAPAAAQVGKEWEKTVNGLLNRELQDNKKALMSVSASAADEEGVSGLLADAIKNEGALEDDGPFSPPHPVKEERGR